MLPFNDRKGRKPSFRKQVHNENTTAFTVYQNVDQLKMAIYLVKTKYFSHLKSCLKTIDF